jgi:hypothetical protein
MPCTVPVLTEVQLTGHQKRVRAAYALPSDWSHVSVTAKMYDGEFGDVRDTDVTPFALLPLNDGDPLGWISMATVPPTESLTTPA